MNAPPLQARVEGRRLRLREAGSLRLDLPLDAGGRYRLVTPDAATAQAAVAALEACPGVGVLPAGGGLLGALTVSENFALALRYDNEDLDLADADRELETALAWCCLPAARIAHIGRERPMQIDRAERWTLGLARHLLRPPELLVLDRPFAGLTRRQAEELLAVEAVYHRRHPFRPALFVDLDSHELPPLPDCRHLLALGETPCPC